MTILSNRKPGQPKAAADSPARSAAPRPGTGSSSSHDRDLYSWVGEQVALLRAGRLSEIDWGNIAEELSDVGEEQYHRLESALAIVLQHMLKWDHQPRLRSRSWVNSILEHRDRAAQLLRRNPGLKSRQSEAMRLAYGRGRYRASTETDLDLDIFPAVCPYSWTEIMTRDFAWQAPAATKKRR